MNIIGANLNLVHTGFVQVPLHLHRRLHLHAVLEVAAAERGLVVGLLRLGLDGRLHPGLHHCGGDDAADAPHCFVVVLPVRDHVRLLRAKPGAKRPILGPDAVRKYLCKSVKMCTPENVQPQDKPSRGKPGANLH